MPLARGSTLGPYRIDTPLGSGGMGEVYRARDVRLERDVAVKVLAGSDAPDLELLRRFEQEARAAAALSHPNIVTVYDVGTHSAPSGNGGRVLRVLPARPPDADPLQPGEPRNRTPHVRAGHRARPGLCARLVRSRRMPRLAVPVVGGILGQRRGRRSRQPQGARAGAGAGRGTCLARIRAGPGQSLRRRGARVRGGAADQSRPVRGAVPLRPVGLRAGADRAFGRAVPQGRTR